MATKAQIAAVAAAQKKVNQQIASAKTALDTANRAVGKTVTGSQAPATPIPTVTIGGAPAGYSSPTLYSPTFTSNGVPMGYSPIPAGNYGATTPEAATGDTGDARYNAAGEYNGGSGGGDGDKSPFKDPISKDDRDAFAELRAIFESYGLGDLAATLQKLMKEGRSANEALVLLKYDKDYNQAYTARFSGNAERISKGLNALSEAEYISNENAYAETLRAYGLNNMLSIDRKVNEKQFAKYMANDMSSTEFNDRISTVMDKVVNADPTVMAQFKKYYGGITNNDLVTYFLTDGETLPILKQKAAAAGIGAEGSKQGFNTDATRAMEFSRAGLTIAQARTGYNEIGEALPLTSKLGDIYKEDKITYGQTEAENEFLLDNAKAKLNRNRLASKERANFEGSSGNATLGAYSTAYLKKSSTAGKI